MAKRPLLLPLQRWRGPGVSQNALVGHVLRDDTSVIAECIVISHVNRLRTNVVWERGRVLSTVNPYKYVGGGKN